MNSDCSIFPAKFKKGNSVSLRNLFKRGSNKLSGFYFNATEIAEESEFIKIVPVGYFPNHPDGPHEITSRHIQEMADNIKNSKKDILFDYGHESLWNAGARAAGWSPKNDVQARSDGLYIRYPDFTPKAKEAIENKEYRYFSPVYRLNAKDKMGREIGAILHSVALTNIPYMDNEIDHIQNSQEDIMAFSKEFLAKLGLPEDATQEQVEEKMNSVLAAQANQEETDEQETTTEETEKENSQVDKELEERIRRLEEREKKAQEKAAEDLVNSAISQGKILPAHKEVWLIAAKNDFETTKQKIETLKTNAALPSQVQTAREDGNQEQKKNSIAAAAEFFKQQGRQPLVNQQN